MRKSFLVVLLLTIFVWGFSQSADNKKKEALLKELAENGCKAIDSINTSNKTREELAKAVSKCIETQALAYQFGAKMMSLNTSNAKNNSGSKEVIDLRVNNNPDSKEYKDYYYEMERYLMNNCKSVKNKVENIDKHGNKSVSTNPEALKFYSKGQEAFERQNYKKAIDNYKKALAIDSVFAFAWDNLGRSYRQTDDYAGAITCYKRSLELDPNGLMPLQNIAVAYTYKKDYENAIAAYQKLAELDKNDPEVFYGTGNVYIHMEEYEKALDNMCKAYTLYISIKSPYRSDAEKSINIIFAQLKKQGKTDKFYEILKANNINAN